MPEESEVEMVWPRGKNESRLSTSHDKGISGSRQEDWKTKKEMAGSQKPRLKLDDGD